MRSFIYLLVIAAAAYVGYHFYQEKIVGKARADADPDAAETQAVAGLPPEQAAAARQFQSKIPLPEVAPGEKRLAKPGVFYALERVSIEHASGVAAVVPGEEVRLMKRNDNGRMKVMSVVGKYEFEMKESQLTNDLDVARAAERRYALTHPPSR